MSLGTSDLPELANLIRDRGWRPVVGDGRYLRIAEVVALLREAGYSDSESTVRRMCDDGTLQTYRLSRQGHRRVLASSVRDLIERRRPKTPDATERAPFDTQDAEPPPQPGPERAR